MNLRRAKPAISEAGLGASNSSAQAVFSQDEGRGEDWHKRFFVLYLDA
jgi:hypothetical protein